MTREELEEAARAVFGKRVDLNGDIWWETAAREAAAWAAQLLAQERREARAEAFEEAAGLAQRKGELYGPPRGVGWSSYELRTVAEEIRALRQPVAPTSHPHEEDTSLRAAGGGE